LRAAKIDPAVAVRRPLVLSHSAFQGVGVIEQRYNDSDPLILDPLAGLALLSNEQQATEHADHAEER
jgi:hypothetical protein